MHDEMAADFNEAEDVEIKAERLDKNDLKRNLSDVVFWKWNSRQLLRKTRNSLLI